MAKEKKVKKTKTSKKVKAEIKEVVKPQIDKDNQLKGIGGWLLFIVVILGLNVAVQIPSIIYSLIVGFSWLSLVYAVLSLALNITLLSLIFGKKNSSLGKIVSIFWLNAVLETIIGFIQIINLSPTLEVSEAVVYISFAFGVAIEFGIAFLLVSYFKKSIRVKNTFVN